MKRGYLGKKTEDFEKQKTKGIYENFGGPLDETQFAR